MEMNVGSPRATTGLSERVVLKTLTYQDYGSYEDGIHSCYHHAHAPLKNVTLS